MLNAESLIIHTPQILWPNYPVRCQSLCLFLHYENFPIFFLFLKRSSDLNTLQEDFDRVGQDVY